jgi:hypothetical protein
MMRCEYAHDDGAYVLGALSPAERTAYERHLAGCPACREAVAEIAVLPGLLGRLDPAGLEWISAPPPAESRVPKLVDAAVAARRRERRAGRIRLAAVALVAACLAGVVGLGASLFPLGDGGGSGVEVRMAAMEPVRGAVPVSAEIGFNGTRSGTQVTMKCLYKKTADYTKAYTFRLIAYGPDGATEQVGSWVAAPGDDVTFTGVTRFTRSELLRLELVRYDNTPLLAYDVP